MTVWILVCFGLVLLLVVCAGFNVGCTLNSVVVLHTSFVCFYLFSCFVVLFGNCGLFALVWGGVIRTVGWF